MGPITRTVQTGIGLAAELKAAREELKAAKSVVDEVSTGKFIYLGICKLISYH